MLRQVSRAPNVVLSDHRPDSAIVARFRPLDLPNAAVQVNVLQA